MGVSPPREFLFVVLEDEGGVEAAEGGVEAAAAFIELNARGSIDPPAREGFSEDT